MYISWKTFSSNTAGKTCARVTCDKCDCTYYYQLSRVGTGSSTAVYGIREAAAGCAAEDDSVKNLAERLSSEAELVSCPSCHWINDELIRGFRQSKYNGLLATGVFVAAVGVAISLFCVWILSVGPVPDRGAIPYFLVGGIGASLSFLLATRLLQRWLRSLIRPNRDFPLAPTLPPGTPPALLLDETNGELKPAEKGSLKPQDHIGPIEFQVGRHTLPEVCCCCLKKSNPKHSLHTRLTAGWCLAIPQCEDCVKEASRRCRRIVAVASPIILAVMVLGLWVAGIRNDEFWILLFASVILAPTFAGIAGHLTTRPARVRVVDSDRGIVRIEFKNRGYRKLMLDAIANERLPNVSGAKV